MPRKLKPVRACTKCGETDRSKFYKLSRVSDGLASWCKQCFRSYREAAHVAHPERKQRKDHMSAIWSKENSQRKLAHTKRYQAANPERVKISHKKYVRTHRTQVRAKVNARTARERTCTPLWANKFFIREIYHLAQLRTKCLGEKHVVDHIIPLKHPLVCGLHVENNLRVIPSRVNLAKSNSFVVTT